MAIFQVSASTDDARNINGGTSKNTNSVTNHLGKFSTSDYWNGFIWNSVTVPQGATITSAVLDLYSAQVTAGTTAKTIWYGVDEDNTSTFNTSTSYPEGKTLTTASVTKDFTVSTWSSTLGFGAETVDVTSLVQEIVDRAGWSSGNSLGIVAHDNGSSDNNYVGHSTYDRATDRGAKLTIEYSAGTNVEVTPSVLTATSSQPTASVSTTTNVSTSPSVQTVSSSQPVASVSTEINIVVSTDVQSVTSTQPVASVTTTTSVEVTPSVQSVTSSQPVASVGTTKNLEVTPEVQAATSSQPSLSITAIKNISTTPSVLTVTSSQPTSSVTVGDGYSASVQTISASQPEPTVTTVQNIEVTPDALVVTSSQPDPTLDIGTDLEVTPDALVLVSSQPVASVGTTQNVNIDLPVLSMSTPDYIWVDYKKRAKKISGDYYLTL